MIRALPRGHAHLAEQLHRAATSICLNVAEGAGEFSVPDKLRFYRMAKRSATECAAILDLLERLTGGEPIRFAEGRDLLVRLVSMLTKMALRRSSRNDVGP
jgi:four helix bundle protein